jgi:hypothetical protein
MYPFNQFCFLGAIEINICRHKPWKERACAKEALHRSKAPITQTGVGRDKEAIRLIDDGHNENKVVNVGTD